MTVARVTQVAVEVLASYTPKAVVTQAAVEAVATYTASLRSTSQVAQVLQAMNPSLRSTLQVVQVLYPNAVIEAFTAAITASAIVAAELIYTTDLSATITADGDLVAPLQYQAALTGDITASGDLAADLIYEANLTADITANATVAASLLRTVGLVTNFTTTGDLTPNIIAEFNLTSAITADGDIVPSISIDYNLISSITATGDVTADLVYNASLTADITASAIVTTNIAEWTYLTASFSCTATVYAPIYGPEDLDASITTNVTVTGDLTIPKYTVDILATGTVQAELTGLRQLIVGISGTASVDAELDALVELTADITASGDVSVELRENTEYLDAAIVASGDITIANLDVPWHAANTLQLSHAAVANLVNNFSIEHTLDLQHDYILTFGQRSFSRTSTLVFTHSATVKRVLPTKTASDILNLTQTLSEYREAISYLNLTQNVTEIIDFIEGLASSVLNLTDSALTAGSVFNLSVESLLNLTQVADCGLIKSSAVTSVLNLWQNAFAVALTGKRYVLLQAPFELIQTSVILPNPLLDDTENLVSNLILRRSMDNTPRTYIQTSSSRRLRYTFTLNRMKALELEAFFNSYSGADIKMLNWKGEIWNVKLVTNPIDFVQTRRAEPGGDRTDVNVEFEGVLLNG